MILQRALDWQVQHLGAGKFLAHFFLGGIHNQAFTRFEHQVGNFDKTPQAARSHTFTVQFVHFALIKKYNLVEWFVCHFACRYLPAREL